MFKSIKYLNHTYDNKTNLYYYYYEITNSDFISNSSEAVTAPAAAVTVAAGSTVAVIKEYENRNYDHQEIIKNLFLLNMFMINQNWFNNINEILEYQNESLTKEYYPESNFHENYYDDLVKYSKKMMVIL